jgi:hypothetical protein
MATRTRPRRNRRNKSDLNTELVDLNGERTEA